MQKLHEIFQIPFRKIGPVILVGGTAVAIHLADLLHAQKVAVRIIEANRARCEELAERLPYATILNRDGKDSQFLKSEAIGEAEALVSCTHKDDTNLFIAALAREIGCKKGIAQIADTRTLPLLDKLGILPAFAAKVNVTQRLLSLLEEEATLSVTALSSDAAKIIEMKVSSTSKLTNAPLAELQHLIPANCLLAAIQREGKIFIGKGSSILRSGDTVVAISPPQEIAKLQQLFH